MPQVSEDRFASDSHDATSFAGKRDLPAQLRQHFTEIFVPEVTAPEDLSPLVFQYLRPVSLTPPVDAVVGFYLAARAAAVSTFSPLIFTVITKLYMAKGQ